MIKNKLIGKNYINREYSQLLFEDRVLDLADKNKRFETPFLERFKFLSITCSNTEEFFQVRIGKLFNRVIKNPHKKDALTKLTPQDQISFLSKYVKNLYKRIDSVSDSLEKDLSDSVRVKYLTKEDHITSEDYSAIKTDFAESYFVRSCKDLESNTVYLAVKLADELGIVRVVFIPVYRSSDFEPIYISSLNRWVFKEDLMYMLCEEMISSRFKVLGKSLIKVTDNADYQVMSNWHDIDSIEDYKKFVECNKESYMVQSHVKLEIKYPNSSIRNYVMFSDHIPEECCFVKNSILGYLAYNFMHVLYYDAHVSMNGLTYPRFDRNKFDENDIVERVKKEDIILSYPYDSFDNLLAILHCARDSADVKAVRITLYRIAVQSFVVNSLIEIAKKGKDVEVLVESRARFDEERNLYNAKLLRNAGCKVIYGLDNYKVHAKLLSLQLEDGSYISSVSTGNFNEDTAKQYTDLTIITSNHKTGENIFTMFLDYELGNAPYCCDRMFPELDGRLTTSPGNIKNVLIENIEREVDKAKAGLPALIQLKCNSLCDKSIINELYKAADVGVKIELLIRGICSLIPRNNITVKSIVGRFLEHSRIYSFGAGDDKLVYISSADLMPRNLDNRSEIMIQLKTKDAIDKVYNKAYNKVYNILDSGLHKDNLNSYILGSDCEYRYCYKNNDTIEDSQKVGKLNEY